MEVIFLFWIASSVIFGYLSSGNSVGLQFKIFIFIYCYWRNCFLVQIYRICIRSCKIRYTTMMLAFLFCSSRAAKWWWMLGWVQISLCICSHLCRGCITLDIMQELLLHFLDPLMRTDIFKRYSLLWLKFQQIYNQFSALIRYCWIYCIVSYFHFVFDFVDGLTYR